MILTGVKIISGRNFQSVPGLKLWLDGRSQKSIKVISGENRVKSWVDLSLYSKLCTNVDPDLPHDFPGGVDFNNLSISRSRSLRFDPDYSYNFFHNGSPFGVYLIFAYEDPSPSGAFGFFRTGGSVKGAYIDLEISANRLRYRITNSSGVNVLSAQQNSGSFNQSLVNSAALIRTSSSGTNNIRFFANNINTNNVTSSVAESGNFEGDTCIVNTILSTATARAVSFMQLVYDWSGYSVSDVIAFDSVVRGLLEQQKAKFEYP